MAKKSDGDLRALLAAEYQGALAATNASKLSTDRENSMAYYLGDMTRDMPQPIGRSGAVSMDVADTIEGMMPQLMEIFTGNDEVVKFEPVGPEDVSGAQQETDYVNHVFMNQNPGFLVIYQFIKDALLQKLGIVKIWTEKEDKEERETYLDKTDDEYALIISDPDVEVVEHTAHGPGEDGDDEYGRARGDGGLDSEGDGDAAGTPGNGAQNLGAGGISPQAPGLVASGVGGGLQGLQAQTLHDVTVEIKKTVIHHRVMGVPPEEFGFRRDTRQMQDCNYCFHKTPRSIEELIGLGYDAAQVKTLPTFRGWTNEEENRRDSVEENQGVGGPDQNDTGRLVEIVEHYVRMDYKGDNKPCLYRVTTGGGGGESKILRRDGKPDIIEYDAIPFAVITPIIQPHRLVGRSIADLLMDIQRIKTALLRGVLDNMYMVNTPRIEVSESHVSDNTLDDLLIARSNGLIRTKAPGGINPIMTPPAGPSIFPMLEYMDSVRGWRTGVTEQSQGLDPNTLQGQSATAANIMNTMSQGKIKLIARIFAETGIRDVFALLHGEIKKHADKQQIVRLRNQWVPVDPRNWKTREDITVNVGLGTGSKNEQMAGLTAIMNVQKELLLGGKVNLVTDSNLFNSGKDLTKLLGKPDVETYFSDPSKPDPMTGQPRQQAQTPPDPKIIALQMQAQLQDKKQQTDAVHQQAKMQADAALEQQKFEHERELAVLNAQLAAHQQQHAQDLALRKHNLDEWAAQRNHELEAAKLAMTPTEGEKAQSKMAPFKAIMEKHKQEIAIHYENAQNNAIMAAHHAAQIHAPIEIHRDVSGRAIGATRHGQKLIFHHSPDGKIIAIAPAA